MQIALDIAPRSPHPVNKIAAVLFGSDQNGEVFSAVRTNHWPNPIYEHIGIDTKIGNSSGTVHAETACLLSAPHAAQDASICITDPFCPNCAKNMAEAGIKNIYIDQDGFDKDFFKRRSGSFDSMSMQICERAGINVYALNMFAEEMNPIYEAPEDYIPVEDSPIEKEPIENANDGVLHDIVEAATQKHKRRKFAIALVYGPDGKKFALTARAHAVIGYSMQREDEALDLLTPIGKYSFIQEPVNRLLMHLSRHGYKLYEDYLFCSQVPTSREQVNIVGAEIKRITIGDIQKCRDPHGLKAMQQLKEAGILDYS
ncbi:MAG: deoxycytidylate deaminase [Alphaproteobacteria bacterium]|nr:deoxycytidylate deaminase [Alphaproteobacteria bacterium]